MGHVPHRTKPKQTRAIRRIAEAFVKDWKGVSEETPIGVHRLYQRMEKKELLHRRLGRNGEANQDEEPGC